MTDPGAAIRAARPAEGLAPLLSVIALGAVLKAACALNYSTWGIDEQFVVIHALGFLDFDLNPRWFNYHTLPMYLLSICYFLLWGVYALMGWASSKVAFVALVFSDDAPFYVLARLVSGLAHTAGCAVLACIVWARFRTTLGALVTFGLSILLPDALWAASKARVDSFVFLFMALTVYFACFAPRTTRALLLALASASAAFACKLPAIVLFAPLLAQLLYDVRAGHYGRRHLAYFFLAPPVLVFLFMPYAVLDFPSYRPVLSRAYLRVTGSMEHIGMAYHDSFAAKIAALLGALWDQVGPVSMALALGYGVWTAFRSPRLFFPFLFPVCYGLAFAPSPTLNDYWLGPVYPFVVMFAVLAAVAAADAAGARWGRGRPAAHPAGGGGQPARGRWPVRLLALTLLTGATLAVPGRSAPVAAVAWDRVTDHREDTRVAAAKWIEESVPKDRIVVLDAHIQQNLPRVFAASPRADLKNTSYAGLVEPNALLRAAFDTYRAREGRRHPGFIVRVMQWNEREAYAPGKVGVPPSAIVVVSSWVYDIDTSDAAGRLRPDLAENARRFYAYLQRQRLLKEFAGRGPTIRIYEALMPY